MSNYIESHFCLYGDFDPRDITAALSIKPSATKEKGELLDIQGEDLPSLIADWDLYGPDELSLDEQVDFLVSTLWSRADAISKLTEKHKADIVITFAQSDGTNTITLKPEVLRRLADLNITLTCFSIDDEDEDAS